MTRALIEETPRVDVRSCVRLARGGRGGPRATRARRVRSDGAWLYRGITSRATIAGRELWSIGAGIEIVGTRGVLQLHYRASGVDCDPSIALEGEPMRFGGVRWWARCPRCARRCGVVFVRGPQVACRRCFGLVYRSTRESDDARARALMRTLAERLGHDGSEVCDSGVPDRPARMWWATYARIAARFRAAEARDRAGFMRLASHFDVRQRRPAWVQP